MIPSVTEVSRTELEAFAGDVFDRFRNPHIHHRLLTIALNSSTKVKERIIPSLLGYLDETGELPTRLVIALAGFIRLYQGEWRGDSIPLTDEPNVLDWFNKQWAEAESIDALVRSVLGNSALWDDDLSEVPNLVERVSDCLRSIEDGELLDLLRRTVK